MAKVELDPVANPESQNTFVNTLNENFERIEEAFDNTLSRDGSIPNEMNSNLDMNSYRIINVPDPISNNEAANKAYVDSLNVEIVDIIEYVEEAQEARDIAVASAASALESAETAEEFADIAVNAAGSVITGGFAYGQFIGNGVQQSYDLSLDIVTAERVIWSENGVIQEPYEDFTITGSTLFRSTPPNSGANIFWVLLGGIRGEGVEFDVQVDELSDRDAYDDEDEGYRVLVSDVGDGRAAIYSKASNSSGDWTDPAYLTSSAGGGDVSGPGTSVVAGNLVSWNGTSGTAISDSGVDPADLLVDTDIGVTIQPYDADTAKLDVEDQALTGGARVTSKDLGTVTTGTITPDPGDRPLQHYTNGGAHTLAPGSNSGSYMLDITNNGSAGAITTSGWTKVAGDSFTTTNGHIFRCHCSVGSGGSLLIIQAMQ